MALTIHVGLAKAASTYLQETFFPGLADTRFVHAPYLPPPDPNAIERLPREMIFHNPVCLDTAKVRTEISAFVRGCGEPNVIVSSEAFFGTPFQNHSDFRTNADIISEVFEEPKIWLVIRRQDRWLESLYSQFLKMGLSTNPERMTNFRDGAFGEYRMIYGGANLDVRELDWCHYVQYYRRVFGEDRVLVQPLEDFASDRERFLGRFCEFAGVEPFFPASNQRTNVSLSPLSAASARLVNALPMSTKLALKRFVPPGLHPANILNRTIDPLLGKRRLFPPELAAAALRLHDDANRRLEELIGVDLGVHGYYAT